MGIAFRRVNRTCYCALITVCVVTVACCRNAAANPKLEELAERVGVRILADATSDREAMNTAKAQIPFRRMSPRSQQRTSQILANISQYRRMPCLQYEVDPNIYQYLVNNPDVAVSTWRVMGISKLAMLQTGAFEYEASAADGSEGIADVLWRDAHQCLFIVEGTYTSPMLPGTIQASALVWLRYRFVDAKDGRVLVNQQVETFITFPNSAIDTLAKLATMITNTILDRNVFEVSLYARMMSSAAEKEPEWIEQVAQRMDGVLPQRCTELVQVSKGQKPNAARMLSVVEGSEGRSVSRLPGSGEFRAFESSLQQVNVHVPLAAGDVQRSPSYGRKIGDTHPHLALPDRYIPEEVARAIADRKSRHAKSMQSSQFAAESSAIGATNILAPASVPPPARESTRSELGELITDLPALAYPGTSAERRDDEKASAAVVPISPSIPLGARTTTVGRPSTRSNLHAKPVSQTSPVITESPAGKPSSDAVSTPPVNSPPPVPPPTPAAM